MVTTGPIVVEIGVIIGIERMVDSAWADAVVSSKSIVVVVARILTTMSTAEAMLYWGNPHSPKNPWWMKLEVQSV